MSRYCLLLNRWVKPRTCNRKHGESVNKHDSNECVAHTEERRFNMLCTVGNDMPYKAKQRRGSGSGVVPNFTPYGKPIYN